MSVRAAALGLLVLPVAASLMSYSIEHRLQSDLAPAGQVDPLYRLLGSAKEAMGDMVFLKADEYFHGGLQFELMKYVKEEHESGHGSNEGESLSHLVGGDWIAEVNSRVGVTRHRHLEGDLSKEALPLLYAATTLNPHNVTAALTASYWMQSEFADTGKAIEILEKSSEKNPGSWEIELRLGELVLKSKNDPFLAAAHLEKAIFSMTPENSMKTDQRLAYYLLGQCYEAQNMKDKALLNYRQALAFYDAEEKLFIQEQISKKIKQLEGVA